MERDRETDDSKYFDLSAWAIRPREAEGGPQVAQGPTVAGPQGRLGPGLGSGGVDVDALRGQSLLRARRLLLLPLKSTSQRSPSGSDFFLLVSFPKLLLPRDSDHVLLILLS